METVGDLLSDKGYRVWTIDQGASLQEAASHMLQTAVNSLIVLDGGRPAGIITSRDLVRALANRPKSAGADLVAEFMSEDLEIATEGDELAAVQARMVARRIHHIPVTRDGSVVGVLDLLDVVNRQLSTARALTDDLSDCMTGPARR